MFCTNCGAKAADDLRFCTNCGKLLAPAAGKTAVPTVPAAAATLAPPAVPALVRMPAPVALPPPPPAEVVSAPAVTPTVTAAAPRLLRDDAQSPPTLDRPTPVPEPQVRSRPEPPAQPAPTAPSAAARTSSGSKTLPFVIIAVLVIGAGAAYFYFSSSSTQDTAASTSPALDSVNSQAAGAAQTPVAPQSTTPSTEQPSNQNQPGAPEPPAAASNVAPGAAVETLIQAAMSGDATRLEALIRDLESGPAPAAGNRGEARQINDQALSLLRDKRYDEAIPVLEQARLADESDVEVVGNLADTLMRAGKLDEAWRMALVGLRLAPRRTVSWSTLGMLSAKREDPAVAVACLVAGYRFSNVQPTTLEVYSKLATTDEDAKVRSAMKEAVKRIRESL